MGVNVDVETGVDKIGVKVTVGTGVSVETGAQDARMTARSKIIVGVFIFSKS